MSKKTIRFIRTFSLYSLILFLTIYGFIYEIEGDQNIIIFWAWFIAAMSTVALNDEVVRGIAENPLSLPEWLESAFNVSIIGILVWNGSFFTATAWTIGFIVFGIARYRADKLLKDQSSLPGTCGEKLRS